MTTSREIIAENIATLRKSAKLTQAELAVKLNYSDKAISKWERAEAVPDVLVLAELAEMFGVTVDYFLKQHAEDEKPPKHNRDKIRTRVAISLSAIISPYFLICLIHYILLNTTESVGWLWRLYFIPLPIVAILALVFTVVWFRSKLSLLVTVSALVWSLLLCIYVFIMHINLSWFIFVLGAPLQLIILQWSYGIIRRKNK